MIQFLSIPHRKIFLTALVLVIVSVTVLVAQNTPPKEAAPAESGPTITMSHTEVPGGKPYSFPILPGTDDWKEFQSYAEMVEATQVPDSILKKMSTVDVLATVMNYPNMGSALFAYNDVIIGVKKVSEYSNVFQELFRRPDAGGIIVSFYRVLNPDAPKADWKLEDTGAYTNTFLILEALISQPEVLNTLDHQQSVILLQQIKENHAKMVLRPDFYGIDNFSSPAFLAGQVLIHEKSTDTVLRQPEVVSFLNGNIMTVSIVTLSSIYNEVDNFLANNKN